MFYIQKAAVVSILLCTEQCIWLDSSHLQSEKWAIAVAHTCSSSSSLFFLPSDWFLWGNRKSSAAVGTPGNTATKSCSSGKSDTCDNAKTCFISYHTVTVIMVLYWGVTRLWLCHSPHGSTIKTSLLEESSPQYTTIIKRVCGYMLQGEGYAMWLLGFASFGVWTL